MIRKVIIIITILILLEFMFLGFFGFGEKYIKMMTDIQGSDIIARPIPLFIVMFIMIIAQIVFVLPYTNSLQNAIYYGGFIGLITYGIFEFTNYGIFNNYLLSIAITGTAWGITLNVLTALAVYQFGN